MAILVTCGACEAKLRVRDEYLGKDVWCPSCKAPLKLIGERVPNHEVFISYSNKDKTVADAICATLEEKKIRCWIAPRDIAAGNSWGGSIIEAIEDAKVMVLVYSGNSNLSPQVIREVERAVAKGLLLVPFRIESAPMTKEMEYFLSASHWFDALTPPLEKHLAQLAEMVRLLLFKNTQGKEAPPNIKLTAPAKPLGKLLPWIGTALGIIGVFLALGAMLWVRRHQPPQDIVSLPLASLPGTAPSQIQTASSSAWLPLDISTNCTADIISTAARISADRFTYNGGRLASASWQRKNGYSEPGLPDDGRVPIPDTTPPGFFQVRMPPAKNAMLLSGPEGVQPQPVTIELASDARRRYSELAILHCACWGYGTLRVLLRYETGTEVSATVPVVDCGLKFRTDPLPAGLRAAVISRDTHPQFGAPVELQALIIPADPERVLRSLTFVFESLTPVLPEWPEQDARRRFTVAIFAISAQGLPLTAINRSANPASATAEVVKVASSTAATNNDLKRGLVLHFSFDKEAQDGIVKDQSGWGNDGRVFGAQWMAQGKRGGAYAFDKGHNTDRIVVQNRESLNPPWITLAAWIKSSDGGRNWGRIFDKDFRKGYCLNLKGPVGSKANPEAGHAAVEIDFVCDPSTETRVDDGQWHHIVATHDGSEQRIYLDGQPQRAGVKAKGAIATSPYDLAIGNSVVPYPAEQIYPWAKEVPPDLWAFNGLIDEVMVFNRALSPEEVKALFHSQLAGIGVSASSPGAQPGQRWTNSLGMIFVPVPGTAVQFSIWPTRVQDFKAFADITGSTWKKTVFHKQGPQGKTHPAVNISWNDAKAFCAWLTEKERREGALKPTQAYRLPTDLEWSTAVGLGKESGGTPKERDEKIKGVFPWGTGWPPPAGSGNYSSKLNVDGFLFTSPVGSFAANRFGLYDMGCNVTQWCEDFYDGQSGTRVMRSSGAQAHTSSQMLSSHRGNNDPDWSHFFSGFRCVLADGGATTSR